MYILIFLTFFLQLTNLTLLPIFTDETNYLDWGWRAVNLPDHIFYSLYDAKQPLIIWFFGIAQNIFADPLLAGRMVSIILGILTAIGVYSLAKKIFDKNIALFSLIIYLSSHYFFFFNRQALVEAGLATIFIWTAYALFALPFSLKQTVMLGILFGLGYLSKSNALLVIFTTMMIWLYKNKSQDFGKLIIYAFVCLMLPLALNLPMLLHPWFSKYIHLSTQYTFTISQLFKFPADQWINNISATSSILFWLLTPATLILVLIGLKQTKKYALALWVFIPLLLQIVLAKFLVSRYLVAYLPAIVIFAAYVISKKRWLISLILIPNLYMVGLQLFFPADYFKQLSRVTSYSYIEGYVTTEASGYNLIEARKYFEELAKKEKFTLGIAVYSGNPEAGLLVYFREHPKIKITYLDAMLFGDQLKNVECLKFNQPVYLATRDPQAAGLTKYFDPHTIITNSYNDSKIYVSKLIENCEGTLLDLSVK
jgi:4-amino-4-deoxy-L-arabinose transferase-like glycosyltransferase